ncbi:LOW QUALITY PROTEIN: cyclin-D1-1 [Lathyrus oleraceus]|uniref:LOW QUALITY PROTEIN: cyclin-D1-1 n=1 Tax=Pisum sativum TaxID=3888 RepID=UPI0021D360AB|nr:LOW QUALITY PROTEIN: cyclin-D1-1 [Pisum sativum]
MQSYKYLSSTTTLPLSTLTTTIHSGNLSDHPPAASRHKSWHQNESPPLAMSLSYSNYFPDDDLLCSEETSSILSGDSPAECLSDVDSSPPPEDEFIAGLIDDEHKFVLGFDYFSKLQSRKIDASAREESVAWILKVQAYYGFQPLTAYLAVNYMDRFLNSRQLPQSNGWPLQLLSVASLSLAAKMEETLVPSLLDLQLEGAKYIFEPRTIRRMELLVLRVLDWRLRSVTPFSFLSFFACKLDSTGIFTGFLISRATQIILSHIQEANFLAYWPSCIAAAAILYAANEIPNWSLVKPEHAETWCEGLRKEKIIGCYRLMEELMIDNSQRKAPKVLPQLRVTTQPLMRSSVSSSSSSPSSSPSYNKRRKLNNCWWVDDDKGNSQ